MMEMLPLNFYNNKVKNTSPYQMLEPRVYVLIYISDLVGILLFRIIQKRVYMYEFVKWFVSTSVRPCACAQRIT